MLTQVNVTDGKVSSFAGSRGDKTLVQISAPVQAGKSRCATLHPYLPVIVTGLSTRKPAQGAEDFLEL